MPDDRSINRRQFLVGAAATTATFAASVAALSPLLDAEEVPGGDEFIQQHYRRLSVEDKREIFAKLEEKIGKKYNISPSIIDPPPLENTEFGYVLNIGRCIGCRKCVYACMKENNTSRDPQIQYIRVVKLKKGAIDLETSSHDYSDNEAADPNFYYMPIQCQQCRKPPCVKVCPVKATWKERDGLVVVDYNWCIGCRYCEAACPYHARRFNFSNPSVRGSELNPGMGYLSNRPRYLGVMEKCTFCLHKIRLGEYPACHDVCPTGARKFGDLRDPGSEIRKILENERVYVLKKSVGTVPKFYYVFAK